AGGLAAVAPPLGPCLADRDAAVIVVIHQAPDRWSALVHFLARRSRLSVETGRDEMRGRAGPSSWRRRPNTSSSPWPDRGPHPFGSRATESAVGRSRADDARHRP